jgi:hypothetical protein
MFGNIVARGKKGTQLFFGAASQRLVDCKPEKELRPFTVALFRKPNPKLARNPENRSQAVARTVNASNHLYRRDLASVFAEKRNGIGCVLFFRRLHHD